MLDDNLTLAAIRKNGGRVNPATLALHLGYDESEIFASLERLVHSGKLVEARDFSGMIPA